MSRLRLELRVRYEAHRTDKDHVLYHEGESLPHALSVHSFILTNCLLRIMRVYKFVYNLGVEPATFLLENLIQTNMSEQDKKKKHIPLHIFPVIWLRLNVTAIIHTPH